MKLSNPGRSEITDEYSDLCALIYEWKAISNIPTAVFSAIVLLSVLHVSFKHFYPQRSSDFFLFPSSEKQRGIKHEEAR